MVKMIKKNMKFSGLDDGKLKRKEGVCVLFAKVEGSEKEFWMSCMLKGGQIKVYLKNHNLEPIAPKIINKILSFKKE